MIADLAEANRREQSRHRSRMIEEAYNSSEHRHYRMPRSLPQKEEDSLESIPSIYNLHAQNHPAEATLLPVRLLITLREKQGQASKQLNSTIATTKKATLAHLDHTNSRRSRIHCTLSLAKTPSKQLTPSLPKKSWLCCPKDESFQEFQTKELTVREDQRYNKLMSSIFPQEGRKARTKL